MTYNVLMGTLNPTHSLTHSPGSHLGLPVQPHLILMPLEVDNLEPKQLGKIIDLCHFHILMLIIIIIISVYFSS